LLTVYGNYAEGDLEVNRKHIIINCVSPSVYPCVEDAADYEDVV